VESSRSAVRQVIIIYVWNHYTTEQFARQQCTLTLKMVALLQIKYSKYRTDSETEFMGADTVVHCAE